MQKRRAATELVWRWPVRVFHWALVTGFAFGWFTQELNYEPHRVAGYTVLGLVLFRAVWGFGPTGHARFSSFVRTPVATLDYFAQRIRGRAPRYLGHNPAGGAMIVAILLTVVVICVSGIALDAGENFAGPLARFRIYRHADLFKEIHRIATNVCLFLVVFHVAGVITESLAHRENLVWAMITGRKRSGGSGR